MASINSFIGLWVKLNCGQLGVFEGKVANVDDSKQLLLINQAHHNGQPVLSSEIQICAQDIQDLQIIDKAPDSITSKSKETKGLSHNQLIAETTPNKAAASPGKPGRTKKSSTYPGDRSSTPKKNQESKSKSMSAKNKECFGQSIDDIQMLDFDFEENLAKFDKKAVFEELENSGISLVRKGFKESNLKLKHNENVLEQEPVIQRQICVPPEHRGNEFVTDAGVAVPAVSMELKNLIFETSERMGLTRDQRIECAGICAFQLAVQVLGGSQRFTNNINERASVVVMAGPHLQGLYGICAARHLANKSIQLTLFIPRKTQDLIPQLALYMHTGAALASSVRDFPDNPVDLVIDALSGHEQSKQVLEQTLTAIEWANDNKAPVLSIDPCQHSASLGLEVKWSLALGLPLVGTPTAGRLFLGDVGIPKGVFAAAGVTYVSPFRDKMVIALDD